MADPKHVLYLFDVDGTLTEPGHTISEELISLLLNKVKSRVSIGLVSGSDYCKVKKKMNGEVVTSQFDYVFCENGLLQYRNGELKSQQSILSQLGEQKLQKLINFALGYMSKLELPAKRGNFIEYRTGLVNLCPVGRSCNLAEREQFALYDKEHNVRKNFKEALEKEFKDYNLKFALGGQISIDVFPTGWDKTFCLNHVADAGFEEIHFFGDKTDPGGNDHEIYCDGRTIGHKVTSPDDTKSQLVATLHLN